MYPTDEKKLSADAKSLKTPTLSRMTMSVTVYHSY